MTTPAFQPVASRSSVSTDAVRDLTDGLALAERHRGLGDYSEAYLGLRRDVEAHLAALRSAPPQQEAGPVAVKEWRCFHCEEVFTSERCARAHFGHDEGCTPACLIKGSEGSLIEALRRAEKDAADAWAAIHSETTDAAKGYHAQAARHQEQIRVVEQLGYDRGIADAKAHPETLGLRPSPATADETLRAALSKIAKAETVEFDSDLQRNVTVSMSEGEMIEIATEALAKPSPKGRQAEEVETLREFAKWAIREGAFTGSDICGWEIQEKAVELNLLRGEPYDPACHGEIEHAEPELEIFVFTAALSPEPTT